MKTVELTINGISDQFYGRSCLDQKEVHVIGALDGEIVEATIIKRGRKKLLAIAGNIKQSSPLRINPPCPHFLNCSGCTLQHISSKSQLEIKAKWLEKQIQFQVGYTQSNPWHYRRRARLSVKYDAKKDELLIGFREHKGWYVAKMDGCMILPEKIDASLLFLKQALAKLTIKDSISQAEISSIANQHAIIIRHLMPLQAVDIETLIQFEKNSGLQVYTQGNDLKIHRPGDFNTAFEPQIAQVGTHEYRIDIHDFIQVNESANTALIQHIQQHLVPDQITHDFFCGIGNISLSISNIAWQIFGYELSETMVRKAEKNAQINKVKNCEFIQMDLFKAQQNDLKLKPTDVVILDPPRSGAEDLCHLLNQHCVSQIIYVSCNAKTLSRDLQILSKRYDIANAHIFDMFSHTSHFETCVILVPKIH